MRHTRDLHRQDKFRREVERKRMNQEDEPLPIMRHKPAPKLSIRFDWQTWLEWGVIVFMAAFVFAVLMRWI